MKKAEVYQQGNLAGFLEELEVGRWRFTYREGYSGHPVSLTMPISARVYDFERFPPVFEGLLPEGVLLEAILRHYKLDYEELFEQLMLMGADLVGSLTFKQSS